MMISPLADSSPFKSDTWRTTKSTPLTTNFLSTVPQFSLLSPPATGKASRTVVPNTGSYNFLIVDDNEINLRIFRRVLRKIFPNSSIDTVQDSRQVDSLVLQQYEIMFLDIEMPHVSGVDIARDVRLRPELDCVGLIAVTTRHTEIDMKLYTESGFDLTIPKPVHRGYAGILEDIEGVLNLRCLDAACRPRVGADIASLYCAAAAPALISDSDMAPTSSLYTVLSSSASISSVATISSDPGPTVSTKEAANFAPLEAFSVSLTELLASVSPCDSAAF